MPELKYSPIIKYGVTDAKEGSADHKRFWDEEIRRCTEGYKPPDGVWIPPSYYYMLNHRPISRLRYKFDPVGTNPIIISYPLYRDGNHLVHETVHRRRLERKGGLYILKGRQKGLSDDLVAIIDQCMRFDIGAWTSYATPENDQLEKIMVKFETGNNGVRPELSQPFLVDNVDQMQFGLEVPTPFGTRTMGSESILFTTNIPKSSIFKSANFVLSVIDEVGTFKKVSLSQFWGDSVDCWRRGDSWFGFPIMVGTIDQVNYAKNTDVEKFWLNAETFELERFLVPADLMYGDYIDLETGISDRASATKSIMKRRAKLYLLEDKTDYYKEVQNNPLNEDELFMLTADSHLNTRRINECILRVSSNPKMMEQCRPGDLIWEKESFDQRSESGQLTTKYRYTGRVLFVENKNGLWRLQLDPINHVYPDADILAIDDYFKDEAPESDSLGGIVGLRRFINANELYMIPTMTYLGRPPLLKQFHDECLKGAVFASARAAVEYHNPMLKEFFLNSKVVNGRDYLKIFPRVNGKIVKEADAFGYDMKALKEVSVEKLKAWVEEPYIENCCDIRFLKNIHHFGKKNSDLGSAFAVALCYNDDMTAIPVIRADEEVKMSMLTMNYQMKQNGTPVQMKNITERSSALFPKLGWLQTLNK